MKIEMDDNTAWTAIIAGILITLLVVIFLVYRYNVSYLEQGYVQVQMDGNKSQNTYWTKTNNLVEGK